jgi:hypothetical protein
MVGLSHAMAVQALISIGLQTGSRIAYEELVKDVTRHDRQLQQS